LGGRRRRTQAGVPDVDSNEFHQLEHLGTGDHGGAGVVESGGTARGEYVSDNNREGGAAKEGQEDLDALVPVPHG